MRQPKLCQRACKANATREFVLKNLPILKKIKNSVARADTDRQESKMTMIQRLNNNNGLQVWKTEHQAVTTCIKHLAVSGLSSVSARIKSSCNLIGYSFEMPNVSYTQPLAPILKTDRYETNEHFDKDNNSNVAINNISKL
jgi:hypothetical protein